MKVIRKEYKSLDKFENRLILNTCIIIAIASLVFTIIDLIITFEVDITSVTLSAFIVYSALFITGFYYKKFNFIRWSIPVISTVFMNLVWYFNYASTGPVLILFVLYYCFLILIGNKKQIVFYSVIVALNIIVLFYLEYNFYDSFPIYKSEQARILDVYIFTLISFVIAFSIIYYAKINYIKQYLLAKRADELKSSFLANMSHEIRTPLNAIVGFSSLLTNKNYTPEKREKYRSYISSNSEYLLHLVNDILDISKIESNQLNLLIDDFQVVSLFEQLKEEYSRMLQKLKKPDVEVNFVLHDENLTLRTDKFRFEQIIRNFLSNAIKFTNSGHITLGFFTVEKKYIFYVEDTGAGISNDDLKQVFSRFVKLNNNLDAIHRGVGLGLFLSKQLAELLGGRIWAESTEGEGSKFYLELPISPK